MSRSFRPTESGESVLPDVVVVDSSGDDLRAMAARLGAAGCRVRACTTEDEAIALVRARVPDVVIIELAPPDAASALALAAQLRSDDTTRHVGLVASTNAVEPCWSVVRPFDAYLRKPTDFDLLVSVVEGLAEAVRQPTDLDRRSTPY